MKVLVIGRGGREHAVVKKLARDSKVTEIFCAPGNDGMIEATLVPIEETDVNALANFAKKNQIDLTIVGPEMALMAGVVNKFKELDLPVFGPTKEAALIEGSKSFAKYMMSKYGCLWRVYSSRRSISILRNSIDANRNQSRWFSSRKRCCYLSNIRRS